MSAAEMTNREPCGAWVVLERFEGLERVVRWCDRIDGPCPFPGAPRSDASDRRCGALLGRQLLFVTYGEDKLRRALNELLAYRDDRLADAPGHLAPETVYVAIDALRVCVGDVP